ncbi:MAG: hypothetical protein GYA48_05880 [Chloroflexi bacterium]|nr:hypothetical protein [Chloroflexota bacterium]
MISAILITLLFTAVCYLYGRGSLWLAHKGLGGSTGADPHPAWVVLLGWVAVTSLASLLSLVMPLSGAALGLVLAGALVIGILGGRQSGFFPQWRELQLPVLVGGVLLLAGLGILENATHNSLNPDTGIYHAQAIRWIESFAAVPGLGNLHGRFAFNSSWLVANALFSFAFLGLQSFHLLPAALVFITVWLFAGGLAGWLRGEATPANILKAVLLPLVFYILGAEISSPGTDLPVILLAWVLASGWLERRGQPGSLDVALFALSVFAMTLKLSAAPLMVFALLIFIRGMRDKAAVGGWIVMGALVLAPWLARNIIYSGYPVYPVPGVPGLGFDWQIPRTDVVAEQRAVLAWGRLPRLDREEVLAMPLAQWLRMWYQDVTLNRRLILFAAAAAPLLMGGEYAWASITRRKDRDEISALLPLAALVYLGFIYWLLTAPDFRFGYGYLIVLFALPLIYPLGVLSKVKIKGLTPMPVLAALAIAGYQALFLAQSFEAKSFNQRLIMPLAYRVLPSEPCGIVNGTVLCAAEEAWTECWYAPFPCIPQPHPAVERRGDDWGDGFRKGD